MKILLKTLVCFISLCASSSLLAGTLTVQKAVWNNQHIPEEKLFAIKATITSYSVEQTRTVHVPPFKRGNEVIVAPGTTISNMNLTITHDHIINGSFKWCWKISSGQACGNIPLVGIYNPITGTYNIANANSPSSWYMVLTRTD